jgi:type III secretory pathway component EscU
MSEESDRKIYEWVKSRFKKLFSAQSAKELVIYMLLVGLLVIIWSEAERRYAEHGLYQSCLQQMTVCGNKGFYISCNKLTIGNYSSLSGNSSFNVSSSS